MWTEGVLTCFDPSPYGGLLSHRGTVPFHPWMDFPQAILVGGWPIPIRKIMEWVRPLGWWNSGEIKFKFQTTNQHPYLGTSHWKHTFLLGDFPQKNSLVVADPSDMPRVSETVGTLDGHHDGHVPTTQWKITRGNWGLGNHQNRRIKRFYAQISLDCLSACTRLPKHFPVFRVEHHRKW